ISLLLIATQLTAIPSASALDQPVRTISGGLTQTGIGFPLSAGGGTIEFDGNDITASGTFNEDNGQPSFTAQGPAGVYNQVKLVNFYGVMTLTGPVSIDTTQADITTSLPMNLGTKFMVTVINAEGDPIPNIPVVLAPTGNGQTLLGGSQAAATVSDVKGI